MLRIKNLTKHFDGVRAVDDCTFDVVPNTITGLIGPNGAGKTTVFNLITGFFRPTEGKIFYKRKNLNSSPPYKRANLGITRTFQLIRLFPKLTVMENLLLAENMVGESLFNSIFRPKISKKQEKRKQRQCLSYLRALKLESKANSLAENLSYGQQKLVEIARVLATNADLILLDEPVAGVNPNMRLQIKQILANLKKQGKTILLIEHDLNFVMDVCDKVIVLDQGTNLAQGTPKQIMKDKKVLDAYLGGTRK